jgi:TRAP-type C4-dicarboxylate transport system permease small subunit
MSALITALPATAIPPNTGDGYVAAAYIVFFAIVLIYVVIMALRLTRLERSVRELRARTEESRPEPEPEKERTTV